MLKNNKQLGFTLIELLVVISIIGVLASIVMVASNSARSRARDTRAIADLRQFSTALELYFDSNDGYPGANNQWYDINGYHASYSDFSAIMPASYVAIPATTTSQLWYFKVSTTDYWLTFQPENSSYLEQDQDCYTPATWYCISP